tara:strand:- start:522 stop:923 length:402 start_codon:yes stop_codon:yes gene_type:complete
MHPKKIIYVDIDGTICAQRNSPDFTDTEKDYDHPDIAPFPNRIQAVNQLYDDGHHIVYWTARGCLSKIDHTELTRKQLQEWGCKYHALEVGNKPHFNVYICDKSINADEFFSLNKKEWATLRSKWIKNGDKKG